MNSLRECRLDGERIGSKSDVLIDVGGIDASVGWALSNNFEDDHWLSRIH